MPVTAEKYVELAKSGERLTAVQRRHALQFLKVTEPGLTNDELASLFKVTPRQIRLDRQHLRKAAAQELVEDDVMLVISDMKESIKAQIRLLEKSRGDCRSGSREYLEHCKAIADLELKLNKAFQDLGLMPKNLGTMTVNEYHFEARVGLGGHTEVRDVKQFEPDSDAPDAEFEMVEDQKELTDGNDGKQSASGEDVAQDSADDNREGAPEERHSGTAGSSSGSSETA